jgi:hypothetical protein
LLKKSSKSFRQAMRRSPLRVATVLSSRLSEMIVLYLSSKKLQKK